MLRLELSSLFRGMASSVLACASTMKLTSPVYLSNELPDIQTAILISLEYAASLFLCLAWGRAVCIAGLAVAISFLSIGIYHFVNDTSCSCFAGQVPQSTTLLIDVVLVAGFFIHFFRCKYWFQWDTAMPTSLIVGAAFSLALIGLSSGVHYAKESLSGSHRQQVVWDPGSLSNRSVDSLILTDEGFWTGYSTCHFAILDFDCDKCRKFHVNMLRKLKSSEEPTELYVVLLRQAKHGTVEWRLGAGTLSLAEIAGTGRKVKTAGGEPYIQTPLSLSVVNGIIEGRFSTTVK